MMETLPVTPGRQGAPPPREALEAWGIAGAEPSPGGQGVVYVTEDLVLKPVRDDVEAEWLARTLDTLPRSSTVRTIRPIAARDGAWVVSGWSAWERLAGVAAPERWRDALEVSDRFHALVAGVALSGAIDRNHRWALGDAFAWGERALPIPAGLDVAIGGLVERRRPLDLPCQLVHGDLCGNILFDETLPPAVIDVSPYWRPKRYADAILVVDSVAWHGAGAGALERFADPIGEQVLVRALLFRLGTAALAFAGQSSRLTRELQAYEPVVTALSGPGVAQ